MAGRTSFEFELGTAPKRPRPDDESAMRILVLGDFSARAQRGIEERRDLAGREPAAIDVDNFDRVMARIAPRLMLGRDKALALEFVALDDFHPDHLYRLELFQGFREARSRVQNSATFAGAAARDAETFARLAGGAPPGTPQRPRDGSVEARVQALIREAVAPHIVPDAPPHQALYVAAVDAAIGAQMRAIVQDPQFKALEALWRGLYWLASNLETDEQLQLCHPGRESGGAARRPRGRARRDQVLGPLVAHRRPVLVRPCWRGPRASRPSRRGGVACRGTLSRGSRIRAGRLRLDRRHPGSARLDAAGRGRSRALERSAQERGGALDRPYAAAHAAAPAVRQVERSGRIVPVRGARAATRARILSLG